MTINLRDIKPDASAEEYFTTLGHDNWSIALPDDYPNLHVTVAWRAELFQKIKVMFAKWVADGVFYIHVGRGQIHQQRTTPSKLAERRKYLAEWMDNEPTGLVEQVGQQTFVETYRKPVNKLVIDEIWNLVEMYLTQNQIIKESPKDKTSEEVERVAAEVWAPLSIALTYEVGTISAREALGPTDGNDQEHE